MAETTLTPDRDIYSEIKEMLLLSRSQAYSAVNFAMVQAYWHIGRIIVEHEQSGSLRAEYGKAVLQEVSVRLQQEFGAGGQAQLHGVNDAGNAGKHVCSMFVPLVHIGLFLLEVPGGYNPVAVAEVLEG